MVAEQELYGRTLARRRREAHLDEKLFINAVNAYSLVDAHIEPITVDELRDWEGDKAVPEDGVVDLISTVLAKALGLEGERAQLLAGEFRSAAQRTRDVLADVTPTSGPLLGTLLAKKLCDAEMSRGTFVQFFNAAIGSKPHANTRMAIFTRLKWGRERLMITLSALLNRF